MLRVCLQPKHRVSVATPVLCLAQNRLFKTFLHIRVQDLKQDVLCVAFLPPKTSGDIQLLPPSMAEMETVCGYQANVHVSFYAPDIRRLFKTYSNISLI